MPDSLNPSDAPSPTAVVDSPETETKPSETEGEKPPESNQSAPAPAMPEDTNPDLPPQAAPEQPVAPESMPAAPPEAAAVPEAAPAESAEPTNAPPAAEENPDVAPPEEEAPAPVPPPPENKKKWYVVKVQSGREDSIKEAIERRVKIEALEEYYGQILIPVDVVTEMRNSKRVKKEHKRFPGYLFVEVEYNDRVLYLFRETSGVGDFVGHTIIDGKQRPPVPMTDREVERITHIGTPTPAGEKAAPTPTHKISAPKFDRGDRLRVTEGTFSGMEGETLDINQDKGQVKVQLTIFGRPVTVECEYWQVEKV